MNKIEKLKQELANNPFVDLTTEQDRVAEEVISEPTKDEKDLVEERLSKVKSISDGAVSQPCIGDMTLTREQKESITINQKYRAALFWHARLTLNGYSESQIVEYLKEKNLIADYCGPSHVKKIINANKEDYDVIFMNLFNKDYEIELTKGAVQAENRLLELINGADGSLSEKAARTLLMHFDRARTIDNTLNKNKEDSVDHNKKLERVEVLDEINDLLQEANSGVIEIQSASPNQVVDNEH